MKPHEHPEHGIGFLVSDVSRLMRRVYDRRVEPLGLTRAQWRVLVHLFRRDGVRQTELANILEIEKPTLGRLVDQLEKKGWVDRRVDETDMRARLLVVSAAAHRLIGEMDSLAGTVEEDALRGIPEGDARRLTDLLLTIKRNLSEAVANGHAGEPLASAGPVEAED